MAITQQKVLTKVFGDPQKRILRRLQKKVDEINALGPKYKKLSDGTVSEVNDRMRYFFMGNALVTSIVERIGIGMAKMI